MYLYTRGEVLKETHKKLLPKAVAAAVVNTSSFQTYVVE